MSLAREYDVVVLGAGNAGLAAARVAREAGRSVLVVEARGAGGTCPLRGCVPKKVLVAATEVLEALARGEGLGVTARGVEVSWGHVVERQRAILAGTSEAVVADLARQGIDYAAALARFAGESRVAVGEAVVAADRIVVATGSRPRPLGLPGEEHVTLSDALLTLPRAPASLVFLGAGAIAFELGHVFARLGTQVTLLEVAPRPLAALDEDAVAVLVEASRALGITVHTGVRLQGVDPVGDGLRVRFEAEGEARSVVAERVGHGAGRTPDLAALELHRAGVATDNGRVRVVDGFRSATNPRVFLAGDALSGTPQLSPVATYEGRLVGKALLGERVEADYLSIPSCVFALPTVASVGLTEASTQGRAVTVKRSDMTGWRSGRSYGEQHAWAKVLVEEGRIVGAHLVGHGAAETIHSFAMAMRFGIPVARLREMVWAYPTFSSDLAYLF